MKIGEFIPPNANAMPLLEAFFAIVCCFIRHDLNISMSNIVFFFLLCKDKQRELIRKGSLKNGNAGSPVNQQPKKNNVMARTRYKQEKMITVST